MSHTRGKPYHPMTQGKIERWHLSLKSRILLENYYLPGDLERAVADFVDHYNHRRYHESLDNLTPADVYFGRGQRILDMRKEIKRRTIEQRRRKPLQSGGMNSNLMGWNLSQFKRSTVPKTLTMDTAGYIGLAIQRRLVRPSKALGGILAFVGLHQRS